MGIIVSLISSILCGVIYFRMIKRDLPNPLEKSKTVVPVVLGLFAPILSTVLVIVFSLGIPKILDGPISEFVDSLILRSLISSFILAGFTEELVKFMVFLLVLAIVKPKKVYQYAMLCAGVGFGFTILEAALYGGNSAFTALTRIPTFGLHMVFGITMGLNFGLYKYYKQTGEKACGKYLFLSMFLPVLLHTIYDAATASNLGLQSTNDDILTIAVIAGLAIVIVLIVLQFWVFSQFKKNSEKYCAMEIAANKPRPVRK